MICRIWLLQKSEDVREVATRFSKKNESIWWGSGVLRTASVKVGVFSLEVLSKKDTSHPQIQKKWEYNSRKFANSNNYPELESFDDEILWIIKKQHPATKGIFSAIQLCLKCFLEGWMRHYWKKTQSKFETFRNLKIFWFFGKTSIVFKLLYSSSKKILELFYSVMITTVKQRLNVHVTRYAQWSSRLKI